MPKASELKKGFAIVSNGKTLLIKDIEVTTPGGRGGSKDLQTTLYRSKHWRSC